MSLIDWLIVASAISLVLYMAVHSRRYIRDVADFLSAGRVCGRYVISVADTATALSVISIVAYVEVQYRTGFALAFWNNLLLPVLIIMGLTGYCTYRFRETRALSMGQFLEMRYSRSFRIFAAILRTASEILANAILPAIAARFFIYFLGFPQHFTLFGIEFATFPVLMAVLLGLALFIIWMGGTLALIITDAIQGMVCFPLMTIFAVFVLMKFSWHGEVIPVMTDRIAGESFLNPFDISHLRDFNAFSLALTIFVAVFHRASWIGSGSSGAAKSPHEQKMAGLLGMWRGSLATVFYVLIAISIIVILNHKNYAVEAHAIRSEISRKVSGELAVSDKVRQDISGAAATLAPPVHRIGTDAPRSEKNNGDTVYLDMVKKSLAKEKNSNLLFQEFRTLYYQLMLPVTMRQILPPGFFGIFCLLMLLAMLSTDDSRIFSSAQTIAQDVIFVIRKKTLPPEQHVRMIKFTALGVGVCFFIGSLYMAQLDYINLFVTLASMMWLCGCAPVMIFGLYSRFGTAAGAWTSLVSGMLWAGGSLFVQRNWADIVYPFLERNGLAERTGQVLEFLSKPFEPYVVWKMDAVKCPVNSYELYFIGMLLTLTLYCGVSALTCKKPFNLEKMLHRGEFALEKQQEVPVRKESWISKLVGVTGEYSRFDKFIAWAVFVLTFVYIFIGSFLVVAVWNIISPWPLNWWAHYFRIVSVIVPGILAGITAIWFFCGGIRDLRRLFRDLRDRTRNSEDNGSVDHNTTTDK
ncbi:MAG: sodium:panthothenate symporter [Lentisphaeria bacterium]|nr:sodium:panthothenate symporter [Lentisphaeria bacterium]